MYYLLTLGFCYFQTSIYSVILNALRIFFHLQVLGNSFPSIFKSSLCYQKIKPSVGYLYIFDGILWVSYNRETKSTHFDCPTLTASLFTTKIRARPQQCPQTIFHFREEKADIAVFFCDSGHLYCQLKHSRIISFQPDFLGLICYLAQTLEDLE